jgi:hypothetical protein
MNMTAKHQAMQIIRKYTFLTKFIITMTMYIVIRMVKMKSLLKKVINLVTLKNISMKIKMRQLMMMMCLYIRTIIHTILIRFLMTIITEI